MKQMTSVGWFACAMSKQGINIAPQPTANFASNGRAGGAPGRQKALAYLCKYLTAFFMCGVTLPWGDG